MPYESSPNSLIAERSSAGVRLCPTASHWNRPGQLTAELRHDAVKHAAEHERHGDAAVVLGLIDARDARDAFRLNVGRPVKLKFPIG